MEWIKCSDRLPDKEGKILVKIEDKYFVALVYKHDPNSFRFLDKENVYLETPTTMVWLGTETKIVSGNHKWYPEHFKEPTHWMPLPELPKD